MRRNRSALEDDNDEDAPLPQRPTRDVEAAVNAQIENVEPDVENADGIAESESDIESNDTLDSDTTQEQDDVVQGIGEAESLLAEITNLKVKRSLMINLQPLQQLCLRSVAFNLKYFLSKHQPFYSLPGIVLEAIVKELQSKNLLNSFDVFELVATPNSRYLLVDFSRNIRWIAFDRLEALQMISKVSSGSLQHLEMYLHELYSTVCPPRPAHIHSMLASLHNLQHLQLNKSGIRDEGLKVVATNCPKLRILDVSYSLYITDLGVRYLCGIEESVEGCKNLEELDVRYTGISSVGITYALLNLPHLKVMPHHDLDKAALHLEKPIHLENMAYYSVNKQQDVEILCEKVPCVTKLEITCRIDNFDSLQKLRNVKKLLLHNKDFQCEEVIPLIKFYSSKLTKLELGNGTVDLSLIGWYCVNLEKLIWNCEAASENKYQLTNEHFSKIRSVRISFYNDHTNFPGLELKFLLSSVCLEEIVMENLTIPNGVLQTLVTEAKSGSGAFSQLKKFDVTFCNNLRLNTVQNIICLAPKLTFVNFLASLGPPSIWKHFIQFIKCNAPYVHVPFHYTPPPSALY